MSIGSIALVAGKFTLPDDVLKLSLAEPFKKPRGWAVWAFWGFLVAPLVVGLTDTAVSTLGYDVRPPCPNAPLIEPQRHFDNALMTMP